jgi:hypothetical protein
MLILTEKLKLEIMFVELHFGVCCWFGGWGYTLSDLVEST